jgi:ABC-type transporter Mla maintaining outer membrane lipid asymmetry ATPase subunit MlaF
MEKSTHTVSNNPLSNAEIATLLSVLAEEYKTTVPSILHKLDAVSGDLNALHRWLSGDRSVQWSREEDDLLSKNTELLKQWKGQESAELRKKYLNFKAK